MTGDSFRDRYVSFCIGRKLDSQITPRSVYLASHVRLFYVTPVLSMISKHHLVLPTQNCITILKRPVSSPSYKSMSLVTLVSVSPYF